MTMQSNGWDALATHYERRVYSLTSVPEKCARILREISPDDRVLIVGCGSATHLQRRILVAYPQVHVTASDLSRQMLDEARDSFTHPRLHYLHSDTTQLKIPSGMFDVVVSTNSIIPESRSSVQAMYSEIYRVLRSGGKLIAYLPSYTCSEEIVKRYPEHQEYLDPAQLRVFDTTGWQCFHTADTIGAELEEAGLVHFSVERIGIDCDAEREQLSALYGEKAEMFWEFLLKARRPCGLGKRANCRDLRVETYTGDNLRDDPVLCRSIADLYRFIFSNQNRHYLVFPSTLEFVAPEEIFREQEYCGEYIDTAVMDDLAEFPMHPETGESAIFWHHPRKTREELERKFLKNAVLALLRDSLGGIAGMTFGYFATAKEIFEMEGWQNPLLYAGIERPEHCRDVNACLRTLADFLDLQDLAPDHEFLCYNCVAVDPALRGSKYVFSLIVRFLESLPREKRNAYCLSEVLFRSRAHEIYGVRGMRIVPGILNPGHEPNPMDCVLGVSYIPDLLAGFKIADSQERSQDPAA